MFRPQLIIIFLTFVNYFSHSQLLPPINLTASNSDCSGITITWEPNSSSASHNLYYIFRAEEELGSYSFFAAPNSTTNSFIDVTCLSSKKKYFYKMKAAVGSPNSTSEFSEVVSGELNCPLVQNIRLKTNRCNSLEIEWDPVNQPNISGYKILRSSSANGYFSDIGTSSKNELAFNDYEIIGTNTYFFKVIPYYENCVFINEINVSPISITSECPTQSPTLTGVNLDCQKIKLEWESFPSPYQPTEVEVHYSTNENGPFYQIRSYPFSQLSNIIESYFDPTKTHYFKLRGKFGMYNSYYSPFSNTINITTICPKIENFRITSTQCGEVNLAWDFEPNQLDNLSTILYISEKGISYPPNSQILQYPINNFKYLPYHNGEYEFKLAFTISGSKIYETTTLTSSLFTCPEAPSINVSQANCDEVLLTWPDFEGTYNENGYYIYMATNPNGPFEPLASLSENSTQYLFKNQRNVFAKAYFKLKAKFGKYDLELGPVSYSDFSTEIESIKSGDWWDASIWSCLRIPKATDIIKINSGNVVSIPANTTARAKGLIQSGELNLSQNSKLTFIDINTPINDYEGCCGLKPGEFNLGEMKVYLPNVFTPNGDGINDSFVPSKNSAVQDILYYRIFDLFNNVIFTRNYVDFNNIPNYTWNGSVYHPNGTFKEYYNGPFKYQMVVPSQSGQYFSISGNACVVRCAEGMEPIKGNPNCVFSTQGENGILNKALSSQEPECN